MSITVSRCANGLTVATDRMPEAPSLALGVWVKVGTRDEPAEAQGVAHLVEHMMFKGTARRDAKALSEAIEGVGGYSNAYTSREETAYYVRVLPEHAGLAVDVLADMVQHSLIDPRELERERNVILQEIGQAFDTPEDYIFDCAQDMAFPEQGLGWPILGQPKNIAVMPREQITDYLARCYGAGNMLLAAAGNIDHAALVALTEQHFTALPPGVPVERRAARYRGGKRHEARDLEQHHLIIGFSAPGWQQPDYPAMQLLTSLLGGGSASRLFQEVREKRGLAYHVSSSAQAYCDAGVMQIYAGTSPEQARELQDVIWEVLARLPDDLNESECARAQAQIRAGLIMGQETASSRLEQLAHEILVWGKPLPLAEKLARFAAVQPHQIRAVAQKLTPNAATIVTLGEG
ncbi:MAG: insulinase family protein [Alphaproteobacteria bacterium]|nr:insulinase family protein [Alphaproteobacteria bacterium]